MPTVLAIAPDAEEADRLEHVISEQLEERIAQSLGNPQYDPHGEPIPDREFNLPEQSHTSLAQLHPGDAAVVVRITTDDFRVDCTQ